MLQSGELERGQFRDPPPPFLLFFSLSSSSSPCPFAAFPRQRRRSSGKRRVDVGAGRPAAGARGVQQHGADGGEPPVEGVDLQEVGDAGVDDRRGPGALGGAAQGVEPVRVAVESEDAARPSDESCSERAVGIFYRVFRVSKGEEVFREEGQ